MIISRLLLRQAESSSFKSPVLCMQERFEALERLAHNKLPLLTSFEEVDLTEPLVIEDAPDFATSKEGRFIWNVLSTYPGYIGVDRTYQLYKESLKVSSVNLSEEDRTNFRSIFRVLRIRWGKTKDKEKGFLRKRREAGRKHKMLTNSGYSEDVPESIDQPVHPLFSDAQITASLVEDCKKAEEYSSAVKSIDYAFSTVKFDSDSFQDVLRRALSKHIKDEVRPVLTNELADYSNPYMMKRSAFSRAIHERCVRNKLEESQVDSFLDSNQDLKKMRSSADLPPEVTEPLQAFRGVVDWNHDPQERLMQKLSNVQLILDALEKEPDVSKLVSELPIPENKNWRFHHPFKNYFGFVSAAPSERTGGWNFGRPKSDEMQEAQQVRYPTLQRVAHSLPTDPLYSESVKHSIGILERSKGWDFESKIRAVNTMKEVYDNLPSSSYYRKKLDGVFSTNRRRGKLYRTFPRGWATRSRKGIYHRSPVSTISLSQRQHDRKQKDNDRKKKADREAKQAQAPKKKK